MINVNENIDVRQSFSEKRLPIVVTDIALKKLYELISTYKIKDNSVIGIKIKVVNKGCGGKKYKMEYATEKSIHDELVEIPYKNTKIKIFLDPKTLFVIIGTEVDYIINKFETGFSFKNSKEKGRCGCGESFYY